MARSRNWDKAKFESQTAGAVWRLADADMIEEPKHQEWWRGKSHEEKAKSSAKVQIELAEAFARGRPSGEKRPKEVVSALISPKIKALLAQADAAQRRREQRARKISQGGSKAKTKG